MSGKPVCHGKFPDTPPLHVASQDDPWEDGGSVPLISSGLKVGSGEVETGVGSDLLAHGYERMEPTTTQRDVEGSC